MRILNLLRMLPEAVAIKMVLATLGVATLGMSPVAQVGQGGHVGDNYFLVLNSEHLRPDARSPVPGPTATPRRSKRCVGTSVALALT